MPTSQDNIQGRITLSNEPNEHYLQGEAFIVFGGVFEDLSLKPTLNYSLANNSEFANNLLLIGLNKYYFMDGYDIYAGLLLGIGQQEWNYNPLNSTKDNDSTSTSVVGALQGGVDFPITNNISWGVNSKLYVHDYNTLLQPRTTESAEINHNFSFSIGVGLRYSFGADE